jgi:hypothetical protein
LAFFFCFFEHTGKQRAVAGQSPMAARVTDSAKPNTTTGCHSNVAPGQSFFLSFPVTCLYIPLYNQKS